eukprot:Amastigsp_a508575_51.p2 type:complete len:168 gc:universal Amastigsp_a508575_51:848-1351(+)
MVRDEEEHGLRPHDQDRADGEEGPNDTETHRRDAAVPPPLDERNLLPKLGCGRRAQHRAEHVVRVSAVLDDVLDEERVLEVPLVLHLGDLDLEDGFEEPTVDTCEAPSCHVLELDRRLLGRDVALHPWLEIHRRLGHDLCDVAQQPRLKVLLGGLDLLDDDDRCGKL